MQPNPEAPPVNDTATPRVSLYLPRYWPVHAGMALGWLVAQLPFRMQMALGRVLGAFAYYLMRSRRRIARTNLGLCFPELDTDARRALLREHFRSLGLGVIETVESALPVLLASASPDAECSNRAFVQSVTTNR